MSDHSVQKIEKEDDLHAGHRDRLRQRFIKSGPGAFEDYELLEMVLFSAIPRRDVKPLAKTLLKKFGSMNSVFGADVKDLQKVKGLSENSAVLIKSIHALVLRMLLEDVKNKPVLSSWQKLIDYCYVSMANEKREQFRVIFLNRRNQIIADEVQQVGTIDHAPVYPREIIKRALDLGASALILVHNHPSGDPEPSDSDIAMTAEIIRAGKALEVMVHDHLIISKNGHVSFKALGILEFTG